MHRKNIRALSLIVCTLTYLMIGAAVFDALESENDMKKRELIEMMKDKMKRKYNFTKEDFKVLQVVVHKSIAQKAGQQWKFAGAFYFATVVITTVGYGHSTPATRLGKMFCMSYALCGIPLNLVMFQSIGERLNVLIGYLLAKFKKCLRMKFTEVSQSNMIMVSISLGTLVISLGTYLFNKYENWSPFEAFYYCYITLTTIGFGDYVAMQKKGAYEKYVYIIFSLLFILFGLAIFSAAVNLFVLRFMATNADSDGNKTQQPTVLLQGFSDEDISGTPNGSVKGEPATVLRSGSVNLTNRTTKRVVESRNRRPSPEEDDDEISEPVAGECFGCSVHFCEGQSKFGGRKPRYVVRRSPVQIDHLLLPSGNAASAKKKRSTDSMVLLNSLTARRMTVSTV